MNELSRIYLWLNKEVSTVKFSLTKTPSYISILLNSANELMDLSIGKEYEDKIISITKNTQGVEDILDLRTRKYGAMAYVDLVICVDKNLTVYKGHDIASNLEDIIPKNMDFIKG